LTCNPRRPNPFCNEIEKNIQARAWHDARVEHHAAARLGVRAAGITKINVAADGQITLNDHNVTVTELKTGLQQLKTADPDLKVVVKGADEADYQNMVSVLDTLQQLDITKVGLATEAANP
jgi:biopolymer transport protein ExbD